SELHEVSFFLESGSARNLWLTWASIYGAALKSGACLGNLSPPSPTGTFFKPSRRGLDMEHASPSMPAALERCSSHSTSTVDPTWQKVQLTISCRSSPSQHPSARRKSRGLPYPPFFNSWAYAASSLFSFNLSLLLAFLFNRNTTASGGRGRATSNPTRAAFLLY
ncbi:MAG: hypothetical protein Q9204_001455, partial [Flavoplaca sp. TL-2023a]